MIALIPLLGKSHRFTNLEMPEKPFLPMPDKRTLLEWVVELLPREVNQVYFIIPNEHVKLQELAKRAAPGSVQILCDKQTVDPLDTLCMVAASLPEKDVPLYINYADCLLYNSSDFVEAMKMQSASAGMVVFESQETRFGRIEEGLAISGIFWAGSANEFYRKANPLNRQKRTEEWGAPHVIQCFPDFRKYNVGKLIDGGLVDVGTPQDYLRFIGKEVW